MRLNRRQFLKGFTAVTVGALLLPEQKIWALDQTMVRAEPLVEMNDFKEFNYQKNQFEVYSTISGLAAAERIYPGDLVVIGSDHRIRLAHPAEAFDLLRRGVAITGAQHGQLMTYQKGFVETIPAETLTGEQWRTFAPLNEMARVTLR